MSSGPQEQADDGHLPWGSIVDERYEIVRPIGEGGMGSVYLAQDLEFGRQVALKVLTPRYVGRPEREQRFANEARYGGRLAHPNIATTFDAGRMDNGRPYIAMEYVEGPAINVLSIIEGKKLELLRLLELMRGVAEALSAMHRAGVVHRDLTPSNILVSKTDERSIAKVIDFSHAAADVPRLRIGHPRRLTQAHETPGTPGYMPPEQVLSDPADPRMDVFSFGVVLWELLSGKHAFRHLDRDQYFDLQATTPTAPAPLAELRPDLPESLCALVTDCTHVHIAARPSSSTVVLRLGEIIDELKQQRLPRQAPVVTVEAKADEDIASDSAEESVPETAPPEVTPAHSRKAALVLALCLGVLIVVALVLLWVRRTEGDADDETKPEPALTAPLHDEPELSVDEEPSSITTDVGSVETDKAEAAESSTEALVPEETEPKPEPSKPTPSTPSPKRNRPTRAKPNKPAPPTAEECQRVRNAAQDAMREMDWNGVLEHTKGSACWSGSDRRWLRISALLELGRYEECIRVGRGSADPRVVKIREACEGLIR